MQGVSSVALIGASGSLLVYRGFRQDAEAMQYGLFSGRINSRSHDAFVSPVMNINGVTFVHVRRDDLFAVCATRHEVNAMLAVQYLTQLIGVLKLYLGDDFNEASIRADFALVYEIMDETIDFGVPQNCAPEALKPLILSAGSKISDAGGGIPIAAGTNQLTEQVTGKTDWRRQGIVYKRNEFFLDLQESVNALVAVDGSVLHADCSGDLKVRCQLSGMPECKLVLNDRMFLSFQKQDHLPLRRIPGVYAKKDGAQLNVKDSVHIEDISFHRCVRLGKFDHDRSIVFVPPDGSFELMRYRVTEGISLPFRVSAVVQEERYAVSISVRILCDLDEEIAASNLAIRIPVPDSAFKAAYLNTSYGKASFEPGERAVVWRIRAGSGGQDYVCNFQVALAHTMSGKIWHRPPIVLNFRVMMFAASGVYIDALRIVESSGYHANKYVRYITKAGSYQFRI